MGAKRSSTFLTGWYAYAFLHEFIPIYPLYGILFVETGLSAMDISVLFSGWTLSALVAEVPSGALADRFSRPTLLAAASVVKAACYLVWLAFPGFWGYLAGFVFWGISGALRSGTAESLLFDTLDGWGRPADFTRIYGRGRACSVLSIGIAMAAGGALVRFGYPLVLWIGVAALCGSALAAALAFREAPRHPSLRQAGYFDTLRQGIREALRTRATLYLVLVSALLLPLPGALDEYVGPVLREAGFDRAAAAYLFALIYVVQTTGALAAYRLDRVGPSGLLLLLAGSGLILACAGWGGGWAVPVSMILYFALFALVQPVLAGRLQAAIQGASRATVTSVSGAALQVGGIGVYAVFGSLATGRTLVAGVLGVAGVTVAFSVVLMVLARLWQVRWDPTGRGA